MNCTMSRALGATILLLLAIGGPPAHAEPARPLGLNPFVTPAKRQADWHTRVTGQFEARARRAPAKVRRIKERRLLGTGIVVQASPARKRPSH